MPLHPFKQRPVRLGEPVKCYRNLNNGRWSLVAMRGSLKNKVIGHADTVVLRDVFFVVGLAGRKRAVLQQVRNVHAFACGLLVSVNDTETHSATFVTYRPFERDCFYRLDSNTPVARADWLCLKSGLASIRDV